jgi:hypothetical protein
MAFVVHVRGARITATFHRETANDAIEKANAMAGEGAVSIVDPRGNIFVPEQFASLRDIWPNKHSTAA